MKRKLIVFLAVLAMACWAGLAGAVTVTQEFPASGTAGGQDISGTARFTIDPGTGTVTVDLWDTVVNPIAVIQNISDIFFTLSNGETSGTLASSSGVERTINMPSRTFTDSSNPVSPTGWQLFSNFTFGTLTGLELSVINTPEAPKHTIIGLPDAGGLYSAANSSLTKPEHDLFLFGTETAPVTFTVNVANLTDETRVTYANFSWGTSGEFTPVPIPPSALLLGSGLLGVVGLGWRSRRVKL